MSDIADIKLANKKVCRSGRVPELIGFLKRSINKPMGLASTIQPTLPANEFVLYITGVKKKSACRAIPMTY